jgi:hypothetical protein
VIVAIHQPNFLPWLGYFHKMKNSEIFVFLDNVQFTKNSFQNRVKIKTSQGAAWLTVPVLHSFGQSTNEVRINKRENWREKHLKTFKLNYKKSGYFDPVFELLRSIYLRTEWETMAEFNIALIRRICEYLEITTTFVSASSLDLRGAKTELLIEIVRKVNGDTYLSGKGGAGYQDEERFRNESIRLIYDSFDHPKYPQLWNDFINGLSIVDLLFNCGPESVKYLATG